MTTIKITLNFKRIDSTRKWKKEKFCIDDLLYQIQKAFFLFLALKKKKKKEN